MATQNTKTLERALVFQSMGSFLLCCAHAGLFDAAHRQEYTFEKVSDMHAFVEGFDKRNAAPFGKILLRILLTLILASGLVATAVICFLVIERVTEKNEVTETRNIRDYFRETERTPIREEREEDKLTALTEQILLEREEDKLTALTEQILLDEQRYWENIKRVERRRLPPSGPVIDTDTTPTAKAAAADLPSVYDAAFEATRDALAEVDFYNTASRFIINALERFGPSKEEDSS